MSEWPGYDKMLKEELIEILLSRGMDVDYYKAIADGSWFEKERSRLRKEKEK